MSEESDRRKQEILARLNKAKSDNPYRKYSDLPAEVHDIVNGRRKAINAILKRFDKPQLTKEESETYERLALLTAQNVVSGGVEGQQGLVRAEVSHLNNMEKERLSGAAWEEFAPTVPLATDLRLAIDRIIEPLVEAMRAHPATPSRNP